MRGGPDSKTSLHSPKKIDENFKDIGRDIYIIKNFRDS